MQTNKIIANIYRYFDVFYINIGFLNPSLFVFLQLEELSDSKYMHIAEIRTVVKSSLLLM